MKNLQITNRRQFLQTAAVGSAALALTRMTGISFAASSDPFRGLKMGIASYSFRKFKLDEALTMTRELGVKYIALKDFHLSLKSTPAERKEAAKKIKDAGITLMGGGVITMNKNDEAEIRGYFEYAKDAGMPTIICSPDPSTLDTIEKLAKEYNIVIAIHNHGPDNKRFPSPLDAFEAVKDRDKHMGLCMDVGHTVRLGQDPVAVLNKCASRMYDFHIKDVTEASKAGKCAVAGKGVINLPAVLKALLDMKFVHHVALEYEIDDTAPMPGMKASFDYFRAELAKMT